jgi:hypothetical protein
MAEIVHAPLAAPRIDAGGQNGHNDDARVEGCRVQATQSRRPE